VSFLLVLPDYPSMSLWLQPKLPWPSQIHSATTLSGLAFYPLPNPLLLLSLPSYALRYVALQLRISLGAKFPNAPKDDILKVVGNLLYHRYMNPCIVAPDGYDIVDFDIEQSLSPDQVNKGY